MSKKYIFFKLFNDLNDSCEIELLSQFELSAFFDETEPVQNVFQLQQIPDLKLLINKSPELQHLITRNLPEQGLRHGYLWSGENPGNITEVLSRLALFRECFFFQKSTDPLPLGHGEVYFQLNQKSEIYNWYIFHFYGIQYYLDKANQIRLNSNSELEIDREFQKFWETTKTNSFSDQTPFLQRVEPDVGKQTRSVFLNHNKRPYTKYSDNRWIRAVLNTITGSDKKTIFHPFCGTGLSMIETALSGNNAYGSDINPIRTIFAKSSLAAYNVTLPDLSQAISNLITQLKMLITSDNETQTDLFLSSAEKHFNEFWHSEKERFQVLKLNASILEKTKVIAGIRFLIESNTISKSPNINHILLSGLANFIAGTLRKRQKSDIISEYHNELRQLYLDIYTYNKIKQLVLNISPEFSITNENVLHPNKIKDQSIDALFCFLPTAIKSNGFQNDQILIDLLNFDIQTTNREEQKLGNINSTKEKADLWIDDLLNKEKKFSLLGPYAQKMLIRYYNPKKQAETAALFKLWIDYYHFFVNLNRVLKEKARICLVLKHPMIKINEKSEELNISEVVREMLEIHQEKFSVQFDQLVSKPVSYTHFGHIKHIHLLFLTKLASEEISFS